MKKKYGKQAAKAIEKAGGLRAVADALVEELPSLDPQRAYDRVIKWKVNGVPRGDVSLLEQLSGVPRAKLRPDLYK